MTGNYSIKHRLVGGFGTVLVMMAIMAAITTSQFTRALDISHTIAGRLTIQLRAADDLAISVDRQRTALRGYILTGQENFYVDYSQALRTEASALSTLTKTLDDSREMRLKAQIDAELPKLRHAEDTALQVLGTAGRSQAYQYHQTAVRPLADDIFEAASQLSALGHEQIRAESAKLERARETAGILTVVVFALAAALAAAASFLTVRSVTVPAKRIASAADSISRGTYSDAERLEEVQRVGRGKKRLKSRSELRQISDAVVRMARSLQKREWNLAAHAEIGKACASTIEMDTLCNRVLGQLAAQTKSQVGVIFVQQNTLVAAATFGMSAEAADSVRSEGLAEEAIRSGRSIFTDDIPIDSKWHIHPGLGEFRPRALACLPLRVEQQMVGSVVLGSIYGYDEDQRALMESASSEIAVAVANTLRHKQVHELAADLMQANEHLDAQNEELQCQNEELQAQSEEIQAQSEEIAAQNEELSAQAAELQEANADLSETARYLRGLQDVTDAALSTLDPLVLIGRLVKSVADAMEVSYGMVMLLDEDGHTLRSKVWHNVGVPEPEGWVLQVGQGFCGKVAETLTIRTSHDAQLDPEILTPYLKTAGAKSVMGIPLHVENRLYGVALLASAEPRDFTDKDFRLAEVFAIRASIGIDRAHAYDALSRAEEEVRLERDNQTLIAHELTKAFLPSKGTDLPGFDVGLKYEPATLGSEVGGDFYDLFEIGDGRYGIVMADVSGKGVRAAVYTAMAKYILHAYAHEDPEPDRVLERVNAAILRYVKRDVFVTMFYGIIDPERGELLYANGGHEEPIIKRGDSGQIEVLSGTGPAVGIIAGATYTQERIRFGHGDTILLYTDGVTESRRDGETYGVDRLRELVGKTNGCTAQEMVDHVLRTVGEFSDGIHKDDLALLVLKPYTGG